MIQLMKVEFTFGFSTGIPLNNLIICSKNPNINYGLFHNKLSQLFVKIFIRNFTMTVLFSVNHHQSLLQPHVCKNEQFI